MPISQEGLGHRRDIQPKSTMSALLISPSDNLDLITRKVTDDIIKIEYCEGSVPESSAPELCISPMKMDSKFTMHGNIDRIDIVERLKHRQTTNWLSMNLELLLGGREQSPYNTSPEILESSSLLPSPQFSEARRPTPADKDRIKDGLEIERPRSALHTGDFTEGSERSSLGSCGLLQGSSKLYGESSPWLSVSPPRDFASFNVDSRFNAVDRLEFNDRATLRAPSLPSSYSSFILKPPTSPLVQSESNDEPVILNQINSVDICSDFPKSHRRHTVQAPSRSIHSTPSVTPSTTLQKPSLQVCRDSTYQYQAHQPRRSPTLNQVPHPTSPQTPSCLLSRRPSFTLDSSPLHASMVGSYEESILRGRMSTTPSKPLDFLAQIGVLGIGKCKPSLRCPPHVMVPFPAVFYSYETTTHGRAAESEDRPSPYVGQIDLENTLLNQDCGQDMKRKRQSHTTARYQKKDLNIVVCTDPSQLAEREARRTEKHKRMPTLLRSPPGGSYRIPEVGQLQIIIKNPNKTAVKLFLVPYDLSGMEPGTKTFIRQRSYSAGPIIDKPLSSAAQVPTAKVFLSDRSTLRYLVHLQICSPSKGRFYLYKSIRVVFANRVPDGKEKLRNEVSLPEPRFSAYKPGRDSSLGLTLTGGAGANFAAEKAYRRRSSGFFLGHSSGTFDCIDGLSLERAFNIQTYANFRDSNPAIVQPDQIGLYRQPLLQRDNDCQSRPSVILQASTKKQHPCPSYSNVAWEGDSARISIYGKLSKGDIGYGGNAFASSTDGNQTISEGLLAKKLRDLGVGIQNNVGYMHDMRESQE